MKAPPLDFESARADVSTSSTGFDIFRNCGPTLRLIAVSGALSVAGTCSAEPTRHWEDSYVRESAATDSGIAWKQHAEAAVDSATTRQAVCELRRISGLTWEQLGELFDVSRRSVHFWASGKPLNAANEQRLMQVLDVLRAADRGDAHSTRAALFAVNDGTTAFELLKADRFKEARALLGTGNARIRPALAELSTAAKAARMPIPPADLVDALHDRVHRDPGRSRVARTVRNKRRGAD